MSEPLSKKLKVLNNSENELEDLEPEQMKVEENIKSTDDESKFSFPEDCDASGMLTGIDLSNRWLSVTDRYFTPFYKLDVSKPGDDICIRMHSNRICMISLAPSHTILQHNLQVSKIDFRVSDKLDRTKNQVSGKGKRGAQPLQENSNICSISCTNGETHVIKCSMIGKLVEVNESLATNPLLLHEPPHKGGYLAIVLPNIRLIDELKEKLLTQESYEAALNERKVKLKLEEFKEESIHEIVVEG